MIRKTLTLLLLLSTLAAADQGNQCSQGSGQQCSGQLTIWTTDTSNPNACQTKSTQCYDIQVSCTTPSNQSTELYLCRSCQALSPSGSLGPVCQDSSSPYDCGSISQGCSQHMDCGNFSPICQYGVETCTLCSGPAHCTSQSQLTPLCSQQVTIYPQTAATISNALALGASPTSLAASYQGDPPRAKVEIDNSYPGGSTWVAVYKGAVPSSVPVTITPVPNSSYTTPASGVDPQRFVYVDLGNFMQGAGQYSIQVIQNTSAYDPESLAAATFTVDPTFHIGGELGLTK